MNRKRLILGVTGATGAVYALRILEVLKSLEEIETHLVVSDAGVLNVQHELGMKRSEFMAFADVAHRVDDIASPIASGGFRTLGMIVAPCSMKTLSGIAQGFGDNLITRSADVVLKERRRLVLLPREAPLNLAHLRNMVAVTEMGGIIYPPLPAFYTRPETIQDLVDETVGRVLSMLGIDVPYLLKPWTGLVSESAGKKA